LEKKVATMASDPQLKQQLEQRTRDLSESQAQQTATSEILSVIASSPTDLQPVLNTVAENAARICSASDALIFLVENGFLRHSARFGSVMTSKGIGEIGPPIDRGSVPGRAVIDQQQFTCTICLLSPMNSLWLKREG
jgi:hypothetical protein